MWPPKVGECIIALSVFCLGAGVGGGGGPPSRKAEPFSRNHLEAKGSRTRNSRNKSLTLAPIPRASSAVVARAHPWRPLRAFFVAMVAAIAQSFRPTIGPFGATRLSLLEGFTRRVELLQLTGDHAGEQPMTRRVIATLTGRQELRVRLRSGVRGAILRNICFFMFYITSWHQKHEIGTRVPETEFREFGWRNFDMWHSGT